MTAGVEKSFMKEITHYLSQLSIKQQEAVLDLAKTFANEETDWDSESYIEEMHRRFAELESGKVKGITLEDLEAEARQLHKNRQRK